MAASWDWEDWSRCVAKSSVGVALRRGIFSRRRAASRNLQSASRARIDWDFAEECKDWENWENWEDWEDCRTGRIGRIENILGGLYEDLEDWEDCGGEHWEHWEEWQDCIYMGGHPSACHHFGRLG